MQAAAPLTEPALPDSLEVYSLRDELTRSYMPANAHERMLVLAIVQAWLALQAARDIQDRYFQKHDPVELIAADLRTYKTITRGVLDCERSWRQAVSMLERAQSRRGKEESPNLRHAQTRMHSVSAEPAAVPESHDEPQPTASTGTAPTETAPAQKKSSITLRGLEPDAIVVLPSNGSQRAAARFGIRAQKTADSGNRYRVTSVG